MQQPAGAEKTATILEAAVHEVESNLISTQEQLSRLDASYRKLVNPRTTGTTPESDRKEPAILGSVSIEAKLQAVGERSNRLRQFALYLADAFQEAI